MSPDLKDPPLIRYCLAKESSIKDIIYSPPLPHVHAHAHTWVLCFKKADGSAGG